MEKQKTYRLREIPEHFDRLDTVKLLSQVLGHVEIHLLSLAMARHAERPPTKTATLMFEKLPDMVKAKAGTSRWTLDAIGLTRPLILDTDFLGITQLYDVPDESHKFE